jgi:hypothetical protein
MSCEALLLNCVIRGRVQAFTQEGFGSARHATYGIRLSRSLDARNRRGRGAGMAESEVFDFVCEQLEQRTNFDRLEARGTVRIALKQAGVEVRSVNVEQMMVVVSKLLPAQLQSRGVEDDQACCSSIAKQLGTLEVATVEDTPEDVFERLGG